jgi:signal peptidase II
MRRNLLVWLTPLLALLVLAMDQLTKWLVVQNLLVGESWMPSDAVGEWLRVTHVRNTGAAFGMFPWASTVFMLIAIVVSGAILYYTLRHWRDAPPWVRFSLGLMLGGSSGNLIDRFRSGSVVDFIDFGYKANWWPVFNVADSSVVIGVTLLAFYLSLQPQPTRGGSAEQSTTASPQIE